MTTPKPSELLPCPFCSDFPEIVEMRWKELQPAGGNFVIFHPPHPLCPLSGNNLRRCYTKEKAIEYWNLRNTARPEPRIGVEEIEKILREMPIRPTRNDKFYFIGEVAQAIAQTFSAPRLVELPKETAEYIHKVIYECDSDIILTVLKQHLAKFGHSPLLSYTPLQHASLPTVSDLTKVIEKLELETKSKIGCLPLACHYAQSILDFLGREHAKD